MEGSLSNGKRQRLAALLVMFVLAVALPLIPAKLADPFRLLAFTGAFCTNGFLALLACCCCIWRRPWSPARGVIKPAACWCAAPPGW
jgi:hypothetical protein